MADPNKHVRQCPLDEGLDFGALVEGVLAPQIFTHEQDVQHFSLDDRVFSGVNATRHLDNMGHRYILVMGSEGDSSVTGGSETTPTVDEE